MADIDIAEEIPLPAQQRPPVVTSGVIGWLRANLFNSVFNTILTILAVYLLVLTVPPLIRWMFIDAIWSAPNGQACRPGCWPTRARLCGCAPNSRSGSTGGGEGQDRTPGRA